MSNDLETEFESLAGNEADETDLSLRAYVARLGVDRVAEYRREWSDEEVMGWDGNFKSDGSLMLVCCERDVEVPEFRRVLEEFIAFVRTR